VLNLWYSKNNHAKPVGPGSQEFILPDGWTCGAGGAFGQCTLHGEKINVQF